MKCPKCNHEFPSRKELWDRKLELCKQITDLAEKAKLDNKNITIYIDEFRIIAEEIVTINKNLKGYE